MHDFPDEAVPWASATAAAPADQDVLEIGAWAADAIHPAHFKQAKAAPARNAPTLVTNLLRYGPHAALTAWLFGAAWLAWSYLDRPAKTVIQSESVQSAEIEHAAQKMAEEPHAPKAEVEALPPAQGTKDAAGLGNTKPRLDAAKTEISAAIAEVSGKVERLPPKPPEKPSKASERFDPIGHDIAALLAAASRRQRGIRSGRPKTGKRRARRRLRSVQKSHRPGRSPPAWNHCAGGDPKQLGGGNRIWTTSQLITSTNRSFASSRAAPFAERHDIAGLRLAPLRPSLHELPPLVEDVRAAVGALDLGTDLMPHGLLDHGLGNRRDLLGPRPEYVTHRP